MRLFTLRLMPRLAAKAATAKAITAERTMMIIQTSACTVVHFTRAFIEPKQRLPKIIHRTAARAESDVFSWLTNDDRSGPSEADEAISPRPRPSPRFGILRKTPATL